MSGEDVHGRGDGQLALAREPGAERFARDERHGVVEVAGRLARGEKWDDVWVVQRGGDLDLEAESVGADATGQLGCEDLDHDLSPERPLGGEEHARHAAAAELTLDGVRAVQRRFKLLLKIVGQGKLRERACPKVTEGPGTRSGGRPASDLSGTFQVLPTRKATQPEWPQLL